MNQLTNIEYLKDLFRHYRIKPKDYLGQNFLVDEAALAEIVDAAGLKKGDTVLEVGPGLGVLTQQMAQRAGQVISVEKDAHMLDILKVNLADCPNVQVIRQDILRFDVSREIKGPYKVAANIPYYLTSHLFRYFLELENRPERMVFLVQKEVAERVTAHPGDMSVLAVSVQAFADAEVVAQVPNRSFWPVPKVDSAVIVIRPRDKHPEITGRDARDGFFRVVKVGFSAKRKQLHNNLTNGFKLDSEITAQWLEAAGIEPKARAEDLSVENWISLHKTRPA